MMINLADMLTEKTGLSLTAVKNILKLLDEGATVPFIARYRKEMTGGATDEQLREFDEARTVSIRLIERKNEILRLIEERGFLTDDIRRQIDEASAIGVIEDIYRPYKEKKNTRAGLAIDAGLTPLADILQKANLSREAFFRKAEEFTCDRYPTADAAVEGAQDILADRYSDDIRERGYIRETLRRHGTIQVKAGKEFDPKGVYTRYSEHSERVAYIPSHRYLAIMRGVREKQLTAGLSLDLERIRENIRRHRIPRGAGSSGELLCEAYEDGLKRLLLPSIEREIHNELKDRSDRQAVSIFGRNLSQLLMTPPVTGMVILGVDPAYRTGCKLAVIDENGTFLDHGVVYPTPPENDKAGAAETVIALIRKYGITGAAIGNGTASRETQEFFASLIREHNLDLKYTVVSEAGASVYSASAVGREEYPDLDVTVRGAISIAQRLRDPMAALVKIDPKSLGIGQYQHDVDQKMLEQKLGEIIEDLVNRIGVEVNSASASLLSYLAGVGPSLAKRIIEQREKAGPFKEKTDLLQVKGMGAKAFEQCSGFIRIRGGNSVLDNTGVHPESYPAALKILESGGPGKLAAENLAATAEALGLGVETLTDILKELSKPGFDPRTELPEIPFRDDLTDINLLKEGDFLSGVVRSIVDFGAFVDVGLKNDGLIHISQISEDKISHPLEVLSVNQYLPRIRVISIDRDKNKLGLSLKSDGTGPGD